MDATTPVLSRRKKLLFFAATCAVLIMLLAGVAEVVLRFKGERPWHIKNPTWIVEPGGRFSQKHPTLGYTLYPGEFRITWGPGITFKTTHLDTTITKTSFPLRATRPLAEYGAAFSGRPEIWVFGCSWTYGSRIDDAETFTWRLQEVFPEFEVANFGASGYGTLHGLIQLREAIPSRGVPRVAVFTYASFHDERNTFIRSRRKAVVPYSRLGPLVQPYGRVDEDGHLALRMAETEYVEFPLMRDSALMHFIEKQYDAMEDATCRSHEVSEAIIREIRDLCVASGVRLVVAVIADDSLSRDVITFCEREGISTVDISVDRTIDANTLRPHDQHPSALANAEYARKLADYLRKHVSPLPIGDHGKAASNAVLNPRLDGSCNLPS